MPSYPPAKAPLPWSGRSRSRSVAAGFAAAALTSLALTGCTPQPLAVEAAAPSTSAPVTISRAPTSAPATSSPAVKAAAIATPVPTAPAAEALGPGAGTWKTLHVAVSGDASTTSRIVDVFTPPVADPNALPVLYLLHGLPGLASNLCNPASSTALDAAFRAGATPFMLACPDGNPTAQDDSEWADSVDGSTKLETFVTSAAIAAVEGSHPRSRGMRAIGGFSMGGFGAAAIGLRHPNLYSQVVSFAGYFHLDDPDSVFGTDTATQDQHDPDVLARRTGAQLRWYLDQAAQDSEALTAHDSARFAAVLTENGATVDSVTSAGSHTPSWVISRLGAASTFLSVGWRLPT